MPTLNWIGKDKIVNHDKEVPFRLMKKVKKFSLGKSENLIVEGDNLEALKALMPFYYGRIKCIYIDPPYNTGSEKWVYNDNVNSSRIREWIGKVVGPEGEDLTRHDKWLCMMYPRIKLLKELLSNDGVIFISIDDNEIEHLKIIMNEVFGERNLIGIVTWFKKRKGSYLSKELVSLTEYIVVYKKDKSKIDLFGGKPGIKESQPLVKRTNTRKILNFNKNKVATRLLDGMYYIGNYGVGSSHIKLLDKIRIKDGKIVNHFRLEGPFVWSQSMLEKELDLGTTITINTINFQPRVFRKYLKGHHKGLSSFVDGRNMSATTDDAYEKLKEIFQTDRIFEYSKPYNLIKYLINAVAFKDKESIILDSFAGTGTTGQAVLDLNKEDGGNRKFILVEMEPKIAKEVTVERIKRVSKGYSYKKNNGEKVKVEGLGGGFEYVQLGAPLFDENGLINKEVKFDDLAQYVYFTETFTNIDKAKIKGNYIGEYNNTKYYLLFDEIDKNVLDRKFLKKLKKDKEQKIVYADKCLLDEEILEEYNIIFKQIPYQIKVY